jgi:hypothetical protein
MRQNHLAKRSLAAVVSGLWLFTLAAHAGVTPTCSHPQLAYFGGRVLANVKIVPVFWGSHVNAQLTAPTTGIAQFFADVTQSTYWSWLCEYDTPNEHIGPGTATAGMTITPSIGAGTSNFTVTDAQIQSELVSQVTAGHLPAPDSNTVYMISFPPNATVKGPSGAGTSCSDFCAYHNSFMNGSNPIVYCYAVLMDSFTGGCSTGCGANSTDMENATDTASHELVESVTDPDIGLDTDLSVPYAYPCAWADNNNNCGEMADICDANAAGDTITVSGRSWVVQELWSDCQSKCTSTGPSPMVSNTNVIIYQNTPLPITLSLVNSNYFCHYQDFTVVTNPVHGVLSGTAPGLTYTPTANYLGSDSFQYIANGSSPATVGITILPFMITTSSLDATRTNFVVCWKSVPGLLYNVMTNASLTAPASWASAGSTNASSTNTCFTLRGLAGKPHVFVEIMK